MIIKWFQKNKKEKLKEDNVLLKPQKDRRILPNVPDSSGHRSNHDRRGDRDDKVRKKHICNPSLGEHKGIRYLTEYKVRVQCRCKKNTVEFSVYSTDISTSGILLKIESEQHRKLIENADKIKLKFKIMRGSMPEGYEMNVNIGASHIRTKKLDNDIFETGLEFEQSLISYIYSKKGRNLRIVSIVSLIILTILVALMRVESVMYFKFNRFVYLYSLITAIYLLSRYFFGALYKPVPISDEFKPGVSIIIPCFNEEEWIERTIINCLNQDYPVNSLEVIIVDDCSNDRSVEKIEETLEKLYAQDSYYDIANRVRLIKQNKNQGKRVVLARGVLEAKHDFVVFVDSDSFLDPYAILNLVQPFKDPKVGGVTGRTDIANTYTNTLTKMQSVRYYVAFRILKAAESYFDAVTCLSGPLACYRKHIVLENMDKWLKQRFFGRKATFGDDRAMTNFVLDKYRTCYQDTAICSTIAPHTHKVFLKQQMRWKRSWLRESSIAATFMWRKEPMMAASFYMGFIIPVAAPVIVIYNLLFVPIVYGLFPSTFLTGLFLMAMMMSTVQLLMRRSSTWLYGLLFCLYYVFVLLWQMPIAWFTFWKSTWGTRLTPHDINAAQKQQFKDDKTATLEMQQHEN